jgi:hypothetical protein
MQRGMPGEITQMILTPICYYDPNPAEHETRCARCGRHIQYVHIVLETVDSADEIGVGMCCIRRMRAAGEIEHRLPLNGYYNWRMSDVRQAAYDDWYCASIAHAD